MNHQSKFIVKSEIVNRAPFYLPASFMNYNNEEFPEDISILIQKCEETIVNINLRFATLDCLVVKDLYIENTSNRCNDFLNKLQVTCNTKLNEKVKRKNELQGLYVFGEMNEDGKITPIYVGISRTIFRRLRQHVWGKNHNETSFSYLKAKHFKEYKGERKDLPYELLNVEKEKIKNYRLFIIPEINHFDMYFMEVYIAGRLKTYWNSFKTH